MVKFIASGEDGRTRIGLGIEERNVERLKQGQPIRFKLDDPAGLALGLPVDIMIYYGATHADLVATVRPYVSEETIVHDSNSEEPFVRS